MVDRIIKTALNKQLKFVLIRSAESVEQTIAAGVGDVDFYVHSDSYIAFIDILKEFFYYKLSSGNKCTSIYSTLDIDVHHGTYMRMPFLKECDFFAEMERINGIPYASRKVLFLINLLHPMDLTGLRGKRIHDIGKIEYLINNKDFLEDDVVRSKLVELFGRNTWESIKTLLYGKKTYISNGLELLAIRMRWKVRTNWSYWEVFFKRHIALRLKNRRSQGIVIAVVGVDGSGKTTLIQGLNEQMVRYDIKPSMIYMGMLGGYILPFTFFKRIFLMFRKESSSIKTSKNIDDIGIARFVGTKGFVFSLFLVLEYAARGLVVSYQSKLKKKMIILDRFISDIYRDDLNYSISNILTLVTPKPNIILMLKGNTVQFFERKGEYSPEVLNLHQEAILAGLKKNYPELLLVIEEEELNKRLNMAMLGLNKVVNV